MRRPGRYRVTVTAGGQSATSPPFTIGAAGAQYGRLVTNAVRYFTSERDGGDVEHSVLSREPANLTDDRRPCTRHRPTTATTTWSAR